jgi:hypothetical protein
MDRGYADFARLYHFEEHKAFFITRAKSNLVYARVKSHNVDASTGVYSD